MLFVDDSILGVFDSDSGCLINLDSDLIGIKAYLPDVIGYDSENERLVSMCYTDEVDDIVEIGTFAHYSIDQLIQMGNEVIGVNK